MEKHVQVVAGGKDPRTIRIGEGLATFALLHHRAYGSVHGDSCSLT
jgi:hypothetical protein